MAFLLKFQHQVSDFKTLNLSQETQLVPYRRNMQDLLCDSGFYLFFFRRSLLCLYVYILQYIIFVSAASLTHVGYLLSKFSAMIPYPEPYQTEYQQRRLGALGIEWCPSSLRLAVGPDFSLDPEYQMFPLPDLDMLIEPLPEVIDAMDWEFENEVHSDDTDSDFNINEDNSSGGEKECSSSNTSGDPGCSTDDSEGEGTHMDGNHRLKRKKQKTDVSIWEETLICSSYLTLQLF